MDKVFFSEAKKLILLWSKGTFPTRRESIKYHFARHGHEVFAEDVWQYLRKAANFSMTLRSAKKSDLDTGSIRYMKQGNYVIKESSGKILSFGKEL